jgi:uncharacterized pyridoxal phosphate-dependent enzyme
MFNKPIWGGNSWVKLGGLLMVTYRDLGIRPVINAWGTVTVMGGSIMPTEVMEAMVEAAHQYVPIHEVQKAAGKYIARLLGVEAAFISSGASAGMTLAAAACMAGMDPAYREQLPNTHGLKDEIIAFRCMRNKYDQAFRIAGAKLVEIGWLKKTEKWELERAINASTAAVAYILEHEYPGGIPIEEILLIAHDRNVPVILDAAAEIPPVENLWKYGRLGVDLTIFSGGKDICGPQTSGLIVGRTDLIEACAFHSCPNQSIGRGMKVGKEEIMAFVTALKLYLEQDFDRELKTWESQVSYIVEYLSSIEAVTARRVFPGKQGIQPTCIPRVHVEWKPQVIGRTASEVREALLEGDPRVAVGVAGSSLVINPQMLREGEEQIVADRIKSILRGK